MGAGTEIAWCDDTHNFWRGCTKVSLGCKNCYAEKLVTTRLQGEWGPGKPRVRIKDFDAPLAWNRKPWCCVNRGTAYGDTKRVERPERCSCGCVDFRRRRVFSLSMGDWLDHEAPVEWLADMLNVIRKCQGLDFLLVTKRIELLGNRIESVLKLIESRPDWDSLPNDSEPAKLRNWLADWFVLKKAPKNIWIIISVEDQKCADERIPLLLKVPAVVHGISYEPSLEAVDFKRSIELALCHPVEGLPGLDWVIVGGESGPEARPFNTEWARSALAQCREAGVPCFVKQMGTHCYDSRQAADAKDRFQIAGNWEDAKFYPSLVHPKGGDPLEWPETLRVREFPKVK